jgi:hypothetical protein
LGHDLLERSWQLGVGSVLARPPDQDDPRPGPTDGARYVSADASGGAGDDSDCAIQVE